MPEPAREGSSRVPRRRPGAARRLLRHLGGAPLGLGGRDGTGHGMGRPCPAAGGGRGTATASSRATSCYRCCSSTRRAGTSRQGQRWAAEAMAIAERFGDRDLFGIAAHYRGHLLIKEGLVSDGLALLDECMVAVTTGDMGPIVSGIVYCGVILACLDAYDVAPRTGVDRGAHPVVREAARPGGLQRALPRASGGDHAIAAATGRRRSTRRNGQASAGCEADNRRAVGEAAYGGRRRPSPPRRVRRSRGGLPRSEPAAAESPSRAWRCCDWLRETAMRPPPRSAEF